MRAFNSLLVLGLLSVSVHGAEMRQTFSTTSTNTTGGFIDTVLGSGGVVFTTAPAGSNSGTLATDPTYLSYTQAASGGPIFKLSSGSVVSDGSGGGSFAFKADSTTFVVNHNAGVGVNQLPTAGQALAVTGGTTLSGALGVGTVTPAANTVDINTAGSAITGSNQFVLRAANGAVTQGTLLGYDANGNGIISSILNSGALMIWSQQSGTYAQRAQFYGSGNFGTSGQLIADGSATVKGALAVQGQQNNTASLTLSNSSVTLNGASGFLQVNSSANVAGLATVSQLGVGMTSPASPLDVNGNIHGNGQGIFDSSGTFKTTLLIGANAGTGTNATIDITGTQATQPATGIAGARDFGFETIYNGSTGGRAVYGLSNAAGGTGISLIGVVGSASPTGGVAATEIRCRKSDGGTSVQNLAASDVCLNMVNSGGAVLANLTGGGAFGITGPLTVSGSSTTLGGVLSAPNLVGPLTVQGGSMTVAGQNLTVSSATLNIVGNQTNGLVVANGSSGFGTANPATKMHMSSGTLTIDGNPTSVAINISTLTLNSSNIVQVGVSTFTVRYDGQTIFAQFPVSYINSNLTPVVGGMVQCTNCTRPYTVCVGTGTVIGQWREQSNAANAGCY